MLVDYDFIQVKEFLLSKKVDTIDFSIFKAIISFLKEKNLLIQDDVTEDFGTIYNYSRCLYGDGRSGQEWHH